MKTNFLPLLLAIFLFTQSIFAQTPPQWKTGNSAGYSYKYVTNDPMKARVYTLANGLKVILSENHKEPRIACMIPVRAGSNTDPKTNTGLAHYLEHMLFKGTDKYGSLNWAKEKPLLDEIDALYEQYNKTTETEARKAIYQKIDEKSGQAAKYAIANEYKKMMGSMGGQGTNAFTSFEQTVYTEDIPANAIDKFLSLQAERFRNPVLRLFHTELEAVYEEKNIGLDNDPRKVYEATNAALFPTHNYGQQTVIGTVEHLKNPSLVEIRNYFKKYYVPNNMAVIMVGDFNSDQLIKKIDAAFKYMVAKPVPEYKPAPEVPLTAPIVKDVFGPTPENLTLAWRWPGVLNPNDRIVGTIVDELMSNSSAGLIDLNLVKAQKVLRATSRPTWNKDYSTWQMIASPKNGQTLADLKTLLLAELDKIKAGNFDENLIKAIAANFKLNAINGLENNNARAYGLLESFITTGFTNWQNRVAFNNALGKVTKQQVIDFAKKYCAEGYVVINKLKGEDKNIVKVEKPKITPVEVNREAESDFLKSINGSKMQSIEPQWVNFDKDLQKGKIGNLEALCVQNKDNDLFRISYRFEMGNRNSKILPLAVEYVKLLGTDKLTSEQISTEFYKLASKFSLSVAERNTTISLSGLNENFEKTLSLFEDLMTNCQKNDAVLEMLKARILKSRTDIKANKQAILQSLVGYAAYGTKNPNNTLQLSENELKALKSEDLLNLLKSLFQFKHSILYYGPKNVAELNVAVSKIHPTNLALKETLPQIYNYETIVPQKPTVYFVDYDMVQAEINWIRPTTKFNAAETATIDVYNNYFGGGMGSLVFQTLRESKALAYSTYGYYQTPSFKEDDYIMYAYIGTQADKLHESVNSMNELLNVFPVSEKAFETAKTTVKKALQTERIMQDNIIYQYIGNQRKGLVGDNRQNVYKDLETLKLDDLKQFQETYIANKPFAMCVVASEKKIDLKSLEKYGEVKKLSLEEIFGF